MAPSSRFSKRFGVLLAAILANSGVANAGLFTDASQLPSTTYDFIVVGAGNAGNVVAARLTEDENTTVLLIEAGISHEGILSIAAPGLTIQNLPFSPYVWNYTTVPQPTLGDREIAYTKGRIIGGSSSVNFMAYTRGADDEYDRWANLTGDDGWAWKNMEAYHLKNERLVPPRDGHNTTGQVDPSVHGNGPVPISLAGWPNPVDPRILETVQAPTTEFPFQPDMNAGSTIGFGIVQSTVDMGERIHSGIAFLEPALKRPNLDVLIENQVTRLLQTGFGDKPSFMNVEFAPGPTSKHTVVTARKEVVLSAGSMGTPHILMHSGIGDKDELTAVGINSTVHLPEVGKNLKDHPIMANYFAVNSNDTYDDVLRDPATFAAALEMWQTNKTGPLVVTPATALGFLRLPDDDPVLKTIQDPTAGPGAGHIELIFSNDFVPQVQLVPPTGDYMTICTIVTSPTSTGKIFLNSTDPFEFPVMDPGFLATDFDMYVMKQAVHAARAFVQAGPWSDFVTGRLGFVGDAENDDEIEAAARQATVSIWHPVGTTRMSPKGADFGVLDPDLLVKNVSGLRVIDGSALPEIPAVHTMAPIYLLAERGSDLIKSAWGLN